MDTRHLRGHHSSAASARPAHHTNATIWPEGERHTCRQGRGLARHDPLPLSVRVRVADWVLLVPLFVAGSTGVLLGQAWGYVLWAAAGTISVYVNIVLWFMEKEYVYPSRGPLAYYTYYWGFFIVWGAFALAYAALRLAGITF